MNPQLHRLLCFLAQVEIDAMEAEMERLEAERKRREENYWKRVAAGVPHDANLQPIGGEN